MNRWWAGRSWPGGCRTAGCWPATERTFRARAGLRSSAEACAVAVQGSELVPVDVEVQAGRQAPQPEPHGHEPLALEVGELEQDLLQGGSVDGIVTGGDPCAQGGEVLPVRRHVLLPQRVVLQLGWHGP